MMEHMDLDGMTEQEASEYVYRYVLALKETRQQRDKADEDARMWHRRVILAQEKGRSDLEAEAVTRRDECLHRYQSLVAEARALEKDVIDLKAKVKRMEEAPQPTVNADALLEQLEAVAGKPDPTADAMRDLEAESALQALREKMEREEGGT